MKPRVSGAENRHPRWVENKHVELREDKAAGTAVLTVRAGNTPGAIALELQRRGYELPKEILETLGGGNDKKLQLGSIAVRKRQAEAAPEALPGWLARVQGLAAPKGTPVGSATEPAGWGGRAPRREKPASTIAPRPEQIADSPAVPKSPPVVSTPVDPLIDLAPPGPPAASDTSVPEANNAVAVRNSDDADVSKTTKEPPQRSVVGGAIDGAVKGVIAHKVLGIGGSTSQTAKIGAGAGAVNALIDNSDMDAGSKVVAKGVVMATSYLLSKNTESQTKKDSPSRTSDSMKASESSKRHDTSTSDSSSKSSNSRTSTNSSSSRNSSSSSRSSTSSRSSRK